jgi:D-aminopeptidase
MMAWPPQMRSGRERAKRAAVPDTQHQNRRMTRFDEEKIDAVFAEINRCDRAGAVAGIAIGGTPVYRKGFGLASMELPVILAPTTRMRLNSVTKHFTCLAYLLLCEQGWAALDDPIGKYLPELHPASGSVTARHVMAHVGGLRDANDITYQFSGMGYPVSSDDLLSLYRDIDDVNFAPNTAWCYCNGAYQLLSAVIERIEGEALENVLRDRILDPVGMTDTLLRRVDTDFVPNSASLHMTTEDGRYVKSSQGLACAGDAGLVSTVDDMLRWLRHMDRPSVGNSATWALMKTPYTLPNGTSTGYGLGLMSGQYRGAKTLYHAGGSLGANSQMLKLPDHGLDIVVMVNRHDLDAMEIANQVVDACLPHLEPMSRPIPSNPVAGTFRSERTGRVIHLFAKEGKQMVTVGGNDIRFERDHNNVLRPMGVSAYRKWAIELDGESSNPDAIRMNDFGNVDMLTRIDDKENSNACEIVGCYRSDSTSTDAQVDVSDGKFNLRVNGRFGGVTYALEHLADDVWRTRVNSLKPWLGGLLIFGADGFSYSSLSTWQLPFRRSS